MCRTTQVSIKWRRNHRSLHLSYLQYPVWQVLRKYLDCRTSSSLSILLEAQWQLEWGSMMQCRSVFITLISLSTHDWDLLWCEMQAATISSYRASVNLSSLSHHCSINKPAPEEICRACRLENTSQTWLQTQILSVDFAQSPIRYCSELCWIESSSLCYEQLAAPTTLKGQAQPQMLGTLSMYMH